MCTCTTYGTIHSEIITNTDGGRYEVEILTDEYADAPEWGGMAFFLTETRYRIGAEICAGELPADVVATIRRAIRNREDVANGDQWALLSGRALLRYLNLKGYPGSALVSVDGGHCYAAVEDDDRFVGVVVPDGYWGDAGKSAAAYVAEYSAWANGEARSVHIARVDEDGDTVENMDSDYGRYDGWDALLAEAREMIESYPGA
jgi:hypothetical protein